MSMLQIISYNLPGNALATIQQTEVITIIAYFSFFQTQNLL